MKCDNNTTPGCGKIPTSGTFGNMYMLKVSVFLGLLIGAAAQLLKFSVKLLSELTKKLMHPDGWNWVFILTPLVGIAIAWLFQRYVLRQNIEHGVERMKRKLDTDRPTMPVSQIWSPIVAASFTLGMGGSAGTEGPIATSGGALGANLARRLNMPSDLCRAMLAIGAGAGIAAIFKAPVGGMLFSIEVLGMGMSAIQLMTLATACTVAGLTAYMLSGLTTDILMPDFVNFNYGLIPWIILLGIFCGVYSVYYQKILKGVQKKLSRLSRPWMKMLISGLAVGCLISIFPRMYGEGYSFISEILAGDTQTLTHYSPFAPLSHIAWLPIAIAVGIMLVKSAAVACTTSGGGVAGDFAPAIFSGCLSGYVFAMGMNYLFGTNLPVADFAFFGMAAVLGVTQNAPVMGIFLITEMAQLYSLLLPIAITTTIAFLIGRMLRRMPSISEKVSPAIEKK